MDTSTAQQVSALVDGEGDAADWAQLGQDPAARALWRRYHVIGDLLRSPNLQPLPDEDAFMHDLFARLQQEAPPMRQRATRWRWQGALAGLAGIAAALLLTLRLPLQRPPALAELGQPLQPVAGVMRAAWSGSRRDSAPQLLLAGADTDADAAWAPYVLAHQQLAASPLGDPEPTGLVHAWR